jgi:hypothetical protein
MFQNAVSFNQDLSRWNVSKFGYFQYAFDGAALFDQNLCPWKDLLPPPGFGYDSRTNVFRNSGCPDQRDPPSLGPIRSMCHTCTDSDNKPVTTSPTLSPSQKAVEMDTPPTALRQTAEPTNALEVAVACETIGPGSDPCLATTTAPSSAEQSSGVGFQWPYSVLIGFYLVKR